MSTLKYVEKNPKNPFLGKTTIYITSQGVKKRRTEILIEEEVFREALDIAQEIYGKGKGGLSYLINTLLKDFIEQYKNNAMKEEVLSQRKGVKEVFMEVLENIANKRKCSTSEIHEITEKELVQAISNVRGSDKRTVKKWLELFLNNKLIEYSAGFSPNRIFRVNV
ncbi:MAG: hypothetical protein QW607_10795 [Desulfurococcaceae archaeon]